MILNSIFCIFHHASPLFSYYKTDLCNSLSLLAQNVVCYHCHSPDAALRSNISCIIKLGWSCFFKFFTASHIVSSTGSTSEWYGSFRKYLFLALHTQFQLWNANIIHASSHDYLNWPFIRYGRQYGSFFVHISQIKDGIWEKAVILLADLIKILQQIPHIRKVVLPRKIFRW